MRKASVLLLFIVVLIGCKEERKIQEFILEKRVYKFDDEIQKELELDTVSWKAQMAVSKYAAKGNYLGALKEWDGMYNMPDRKYSTSKADSLRQKYQQVNAKQVIIEEAKNTSVVIINEAHHNSFHRQFTASLLQDLYDQGYRHLGLEALDNSKTKDSLLNERGYPIITSGYYTQDPNFSVFIREAIKIGFQLFPYDQNIGVNNKLREIEQAKNIYNYMKDYPDDKFLIHCGFDHLFEGEYGRLWEKAMAERLKELSQVDPLTIHQTVYSHKSNRKNNHPLLKVFDPKESIVLKDKQGKMLGYTRGKATTDIAVFHPEPKTIDGRLANNANTLNILNVSELKFEYPSMLWVYEETDDIRNAVPIYIGELLDSTETVPVPLESGRYIFAIVQENNKVLTFKKQI